MNRFLCKTKFGGGGGNFHANVNYVFIAVVQGIVRLKF